MKKLSTIMLGTAVVAFVGGFIEAARPGGWGIGIPLGAVFLGLFAITRVLAGEAQRFDYEEQARVAAAEKTGVTQGGSGH